MNAHHLLTEDNPVAGIPAYVEMLRQLAGSVGDLAGSTTRLIWMLSQPILDDARGNYPLRPNTFDIHSGKVRIYNLLARDILT